MGVVKTQWEVFNQDDELVMTMEGYGMFQRREPGERGLMLVPLNHKVHVLFRRQDLDMVKLEGKVVVVLDVLFATSTMITALPHGASAVIPTLDEAHAPSRGEGAARPAPTCCPASCSRRRSRDLRRPRRWRWSSTA